MCQWAGDNVACRTDRDPDGVLRRRFFVPGTECQALVLECLAPRLPVPGSEPRLWRVTQLWLGAWHRTWRGVR